jgi:hypothetical protein
MKTIVGTALILKITYSTANNGLTASVLQEFLEALLVKVK